MCAEILHFSKLDSYVTTGKEKSMTIITKIHDILSCVLNHKLNGQYYCCQCIPHAHMWYLLPDRLASLLAPLTLLHCLFTATNPGDIFTQLHVVTSVCTKTSGARVFSREALPRCQLFPGEPTLDQLWHA